MKLLAGTGLVVVLGALGSGPVAANSSAPTSTMTSRLQAYVAALEAKASVAGNGSPANLWGNPVLVEVSPPVRLGHTYMVVAAYSFDPAGHPVKVLAYQRGAWKPVASLAAPVGQGRLVHPDAVDLISEQTPVSDLPLGGTGQPGFLIAQAGGGCSEASVVMPATSGTQWRYLSFTGPFPKSQIVGGNPRVVGRTIVTDNDCTAVATPADQRSSYIWTYHRTSGALVGVRHAGWPAQP